MGKRDKVDRRRFLQGGLLGPAAAMMSPARHAAGAESKPRGEAAGLGDPAAGEARVWEKQELAFTASQSYSNAYTTVTVWVDLTGPNFSKRVYGFWDGGQTFKVRVLATAPGVWKWRSG